MKTPAANRWLAGLLLVSAAAIARAPVVDLPLATNLQADAAMAKEQGVPILVLYSLPGCPACEQIRQSHLLPMLRDPANKGKVIVRQIDLNSTKRLTDFAGNKTTHGEYSQGQGIRFAPIVRVLGPDGNLLADPLVGTLLPDFYGAYLEDALVVARSKLAAKKVI